jgi:hypothetical protein
VQGDGPHAWREGGEGSKGSRSIGLRGSCAREQFRFAAPATVFIPAEAC